MTGKHDNWPGAIVFDLDGTLIDSVIDISNALNHALDRRGLPPFSVDHVREMIGGGVPKLVERALRAHGVSIIGMMPLAADFIRFYRQNLTPNTTLYDGARELLDDLHAEGVKLGICTNKRHDLAVETLRQLDIEKYFSAVAGERFGRPRKPDPAPLRSVIATLGASTAGAIMVGDSAADVDCARAAGVPCAVVSFGYSHADPTSLGADFVIDRLSDFRDRLVDYRTSRSAATAGN